MLRQMMGLCMAGHYPTMGMSFLGGGQTSHILDVTPHGPRVLNPEFHQNPSSGSRVADAHFGDYDKDSIYCMSLPIVTYR